jgi:AraC-like DNA-binding protein
MKQPSFDTWTSLFLFAAIQGIFVSSVLWFSKKENRFNTRLLSLFIFLFSFTLIEYVLYWTGYQVRFPHALGLERGLPFLYGVILLFYFRNVFEHKTFTPKDLWHLLPFFIYLVAELPLYITSSGTKSEWMHGNRVPPSLFRWPEEVMRHLPVSPWLYILHMSMYTVMLINLYNATSKTNSEVRLWFQWLVGLFGAFIVSSASYFILIHFSFFNVKWDYMISFSMMFFIGFIAWFGYMQPKIFSGLTIKEAFKTNMRYKNSALTPDHSLELIVQLKNMMDEKKLYRENDLRLEKLAAEMNLSRHHLSQLLNEQTGMNFFEYVNQFRVREAKDLLSQTSKKELNIIDVAYSVGFNNKVSFNTTFKKMTGKTPTEFRKEFEEKKKQSAIQ